MATRLADCQRSLYCERRDRCYLNSDEMECFEGAERNSTGMLVGGIVSVGAGVIIGGGTLLLGDVALAIAGAYPVPPRGSRRRRA